MEIFDLGKQLLSLIDAFFELVEKYDARKKRLLDEKAQQEFAEARGTLIGIHQLPGNFSWVLSGGTTFVENHDQVVKEMAAEQLAKIEKDAPKIHHAICQVDVHLAEIIQQILNAKKMIFRVLKRLHDQTP